MKHGELKEYIAAGTTKDDFFRRVQNALNPAPRLSPHLTPVRQPVPSTPPASSFGLSSSPEADTSESVRRVLAERAARGQQAKEEAERKEKEAKAKAEAAEAAEAAKAEEKKARSNAQAEDYRMKRQKQSEERQRILKRIEEDKESRRKQAEERERQRRMSTDDGTSSIASSVGGTKLPSTTRIGEMTAIQVRLLDGSTIRSRFKTASSVTEIRKWVDGERTDGDLPYKFKQILTPLPNRNIDVSEESKSLRETGLAPSSTLLLIPVPKFASAYSENQGGIFGQILALILGFFTAILNLVGLGGQSDAANTEQRREPAPSAPTSGVSTPQNRRIHGFETPTGEQKDYQLYNGNSVCNFYMHPKHCMP